MNVILYNLDFQKDFLIKDYFIIEIENRLLYKNVLANIKGFQNDILDIALFDNQKQLEHGKDYACIVDFYDYEYFSKTIISKLYKDLDLHYKNDIEVQKKIYSINTKIFDFVKNILLDYDIDFDFDSELQIEDIMKIVSLKPTEDKSQTATSFVNYISVISQLKLFKLLILVNSQSFFSKSEIEEIIKIANYKNIKLLLIDNKINDNFNNNIAKIDSDGYLFYEKS